MVYVCGTLSLSFMKTDVCVWLMHTELTVQIYIIESSFPFKKLHLVEILDGLNIFDFCLQLKHLTVALDLKPLKVTGLVTC